MSCIFMSVIFSGAVSETISSHFLDTGSQAYWVHNRDLSGSCDVIGHVTIQLAMDHFLLVVLWTQVSYL